MEKGTGENLLFKKVSSDQPVVDYLLQTLKDHLEKSETVLWLVAGGSAMNTAVAVSKRLSGYKNLAKLTVSLTDERYGPPDHADSNWQQLSAMGFSLPGARLQPALDGSSLDETAQKYSKFLDEAIKTANYSVALTGMGPDGHIFGIKPGSPAINSDQEVIGYDWDDYVRLTPTPKLIKHLNEIIVFAVGKEKADQLDKLSRTLPANEQPAQLLKTLPKVTIFNDYKGE